MNSESHTRCEARKRPDHSPAARKSQQLFARQGPTTGQWTLLTDAMVHSGTLSSHLSDARTRMTRRALRAASAASPSLLGPGVSKRGGPPEETQRGRPRAAQTDPMAQRGMKLST